MSKICIYGAGAVGCTIGGRLALAGEDVTFIGRGEHLAKSQKNGLILVTKEGETRVDGEFIDETQKIAEPDFLFLTVKAYDLPNIAENAAKIAGKNTAIIPVMNGIPWWHFYKLPGELQDYCPDGLDNGEKLRKNINPASIIGGVMYVDATILEPGRVKHMMNPKFKIGEPSGKSSKRSNNLADILAKAGFKNPAAENIRSEIWLKLCWNIAFNPLSVITGFNSGQIATNEETKETASAMMHELKLITDALAIPLKLDVDERLAIGVRGGTHKPSMLQDFEAGKSLEIDAIIGAVTDIALKLAIPTPTINSVYALLYEKSCENG